MVNSVEFSKRLQKIIEYYELTATSFADLISFNRSTISHLLSGRNKPSLEFVIKVLEAFPEVELYWLLKGKGTFPTTQNVPINNETLFTQSDNDYTPQPKKQFQQIETKEDNSNFIENFQENEIEQIVIFFKDNTFKVYKP